MHSGEKSFGFIRFLKDDSPPKKNFFLKILCKKIIINILCIHERQREAETQAEGEAGSMQGANMGPDPGSPGSHPGLQGVPNLCATRAAPPFGILM